MLQTRPMNTPTNNSKNILNSDVELKGNINVNTVVVRGKINGNVIAREKIDIKAKTEMFGDIRAPKLVIEEGVTFVGKSEVNPNKVAPAAPPPPSSAEAVKL